MSVLDIKLSPMAETDASEATSAEPNKVEYDPITGVPPEFNEYLPKDCDEYKRYVK